MAVSSVADVIVLFVVVALVSLRRDDDTFALLFCFDRQLGSLLLCRDVTELLVLASVELRNDVTDGVNLVLVITGKDIDEEALFFVLLALEVILAAEVADENPRGDAFLGDAFGLTPFPLEAAFFYRKKTS